MTSKLTQEGLNVRIALQKPWWRYFIALPVMAGAGFFLWLAALLLADILSYRVNGNIDFIAAPFLLLIAAALTALGLVIVATRSVVVDKASGRFCRFLHVGPFKWRRDFDLSEFKSVKVIWQPDSDNRGGSNVVYLASEKGELLQLDAYPGLKPANDKAREIGKAIGLPALDESDIEPDDPDLDDAAESGDERPAATRKATAPQKREPRKRKRYSLEGVSVAKGEVSVRLPAPAYAPWLIYPLVSLNFGLWWLDWQAVQGLPHKFQSLGSGGHAWLSVAGIVLALVAATIVAGLPLAALAGLEDRLVFNKSGHEVAVVRKSALIHWRRPSPLSAFANLSIETRPGKNPKQPFAVQFVADPGMRPRLLGAFETKELARGFADAIAVPAGLSVVDVG